MRRPFGIRLWREMQRYAKVEGDKVLREKIQANEEFILWIGVTGKLKWRVRGKQKSLQYSK